MNIEEKLRKALKALGRKGTVTYKPITPHPKETLYDVYINGEHSGVHDTVKDTFVD